MKFLPATPLQPAEYVRNCYFIRVPADATLEDIQRGSFWTHHAALLRPDDEVTVVRVDGAFDVHLRVIASNKEMGALFRPLRIYVTDAANTAITDSAPESVDQDGVPVGFKIEWAGPKARFRVKRDVDASVVKSGFSTRDDAVAWAKDNAAFA